MATANDRRLIAWCAHKDAQCGIQDDPGEAMAGWQKAAQHASQHVGLDPLAETISRIGIAAAAGLYQDAIGELRPRRTAQSS